MDDIKINIASFEDGSELKRCVFLVAVKNGFKFSDLFLDDNIDRLLNLVLLVDSDKDVNNALWACLSRCTYKGEKITKATFDSAENRSLYFPIASKCIQVNLTPFLNGLRSAWEAFRNPENTLNSPQ